MLSRETIRRNVNKIICCVFKSRPNQPNITNYSFQVGYISQVRKHINDIKFLKQSIGHRKIDITFSYVEEVSN